MAKNKITKEIDKLDKEIVELISKRARKVHELALLRDSEEEITKNNRVNEIIQNVRQTAIKEELSPSMIDDIYQIMIKEMIVLEITEYKNKKFF